MGRREGRRSGEKSGRRERVKGKQKYECRKESGIRDTRGQDGGKVGF